MTDYAELLQPDRGQPAHDLMLVDADGFSDWLAAAPEAHRELIAAQGFTGKGYQIAILPGEPPGAWSAALGVADPDRLSSWCLAKAAESLPEGVYRVAGRDPGPAAMGWLLAQFRFDRYRSRPEPVKTRVLLVSRPRGIAAAVALAEAIDLIRAMVNTGAGDMGPAQIEDVARDIASRGGAKIRVTAGDALEQGYPMVAAVGRAASRDRAPRLIELEWGNPDHPRIAIVGKGVCFDSGGLDIKTAAGMLLMKKDMGGAASALALGHMVMAAKLDVRLRILIPAAENSIAGNAFRPGDVLTSRAGKTVEIGNTDAEGRLVLADALALADAERPAAVISFATLTGAARVALGPDLPPLYCDDDALAQAIVVAGNRVGDPVWRMPFWSAYEANLDSAVADMNNVSESPFAGSVTAALFLRRFVKQAACYMHLDIYGWRQAAKALGPKGGEPQAARAVFEVLRAGGLR